MSLSGDRPHNGAWVAASADGVSPNHMGPRPALCGLAADVRFAARSLVRARGFTTVAVIALALGIGANTAIFSVVNAVLLRPLPYREPQRLVWFWEVQPFLDRAPFSAPDFADYRGQNQTFESVVAFRGGNLTLTGAGEPERISGAQVDAGFFPILGVRPALGRDFTADEDKPGAPAAVVVLSHGFWQRKHGGDSQIVGKALTFNGRTYSVVGVMPPGFSFPGETELWTPLGLNPAGQQRGSHWLIVIGRLKPGVSLARAQADIDVVVRRLQQQYPPSNQGHSVTLVSLEERLVGHVRRALLVLLAAVGFVLLIACANVANLMLARAAVRRREIAIRAALGAGRWRLVRQLLAESAVLGVIGGAAGLVLAAGAMRAMVALAPANVPRLSEVRLDLSVLAFTLAASLFTALLFGLAPAFDAARASVADFLKESGRTSSAGAGRAKLRSGLVIAEIALAVVLLAGAGLMLRSFVVLQQVEPGLRPEGLLTARVSLIGRSAFNQPRLWADFYDRVLANVRQLPGVKAAAAINLLPLDDFGIGNSTNFRVIGRPEPAPKDMPLSEIRVVSLDYFRTMGIPLIKGRVFTERDTKDSEPVAVISESLAWQIFPGEDPLGKRITVSIDKGSEIVGVAGNVHDYGLDAPLRLESYIPMAQMPNPLLTIVVRTAGDPRALVPAFRQAVWSVENDRPIYAIRTMEQVISRSVAQPRFRTALLGLFAALALLLAAVGIYGVISYAVAQRVQEIGIRVALGATRPDVLRLVMGQGMLLAGSGLALGLAGAWAGTRWISALLFGIRPTEPVVFGALVLLLALVALLACWAPARRATRVDPVVALRQE